MHRSFAVFLLGLTANVVQGNSVSPLQKVLALLSDLHAKVLQEGREEAATYSKFATFCSDTKTSKTSAISAGEVSQSDLEARVNSAASRLQQEETAFAAKVQAIQTIEEEITNLRSSRHAAALDYAKSEVDLTRALQGLDAAIQMLKSAKTATALVQLQKLSDSSSLTAQHEREVLEGALTRLRQIPDSIYSFHAQDIITTLEGLRTQFRDQKVQLNNQETSDRQAFESLLQTKTSAVTQERLAMDTHRQNAIRENQTIALAGEDLQVTTAQLLDDRKYLAELTETCDKKAKAWEERKQTRESEAESLSRALGILTLLNNSQLAPPSLLQQQILRRSKPLRALATPHQQRQQQQQQWAAAPPPQARQGERRAQAAAVAMQAMQPPQLPHSSPLHLRGGGGQADAEAEEWRPTLASVLQTAAGRLHSALLLRAAGSAQEDPFAKVKQLIQGLIDRLLTEASRELDHKSWCDQQLALARQSRDGSTASIVEVNIQLEVGEVRRAKLAREIQEVEKDLTALNTSLSEGNATREQERTQNLHLMEDARQGRDAVVQAVTVLERFYGEAASNASSSSSSLLQFRDKVQASPGGSFEDDAPDVGFDGPYTGAVGAKDGILGLLEVIRSDFERSISDAAKAEQEAARTYYELQVTAGSSLAEKGEVKLSLERLLQAADSDDQEGRASLDRLQSALDGAVTQLEALRGSCLEAGTTAEERRLQREEEMEVLRRALCILERHGIGGIESC